MHCVGLYSEYHVYAKQTFLCLVIPRYLPLKAYLRKVPDLGIWAGKYILTIVVESSIIFVFHVNVVII